MDPNETLRWLREGLRDYARADSANDEADMEQAADLIYQSAQALDEWLTRGGFLPDSWKPSSYDSNPAR